MRKLLMLGVALASITVAAPALAQSDNTKAAVGATAGGATGGTIGFLLGGPIGAIIGGWTGAVIGADAAVSDASIRYVGAHPVEPVRIQGSIDVGYVVGDDIVIHPIEGDDKYGYFYANGRVWIVDLGTHKVVQSPGFTIRKDAVAYVKANKVNNVTISGDLQVGARLDPGVELTAVPDSDFSYVYVGDRPALVDTGSRTVVWIEG